MSDLTGRRIVVTGAAGALGPAVVAAVSARGAQVMGLTRADADLSDEAAVTAAFRRAAERMGGLDGLVNVAGGFAFGAVMDAGPDLWRDMLERNLISAVNACRAALPLFNGPAAIVNIGSAASAASATAGLGPYAASKAGLASLTQALAAEQEPKGVRVGILMVTTLDTPQNRAAMPNADRSGWMSLDHAADEVCRLLAKE